MFDVLSVAEIDGQHAALLPARTVLSLFSTGGGSHTTSACSGNGNNAGGLLNVPILNLLNGVNILSNCTAVGG